MLVWTDVCANDANGLKKECAMRICETSYTEIVTIILIDFRLIFYNLKQKETKKKEKQA